MKLSYREARLEDIDRLAEIYNHAVRETVSTFDTEEKLPDYFLSFIPGDHLHRMLVAVEGGEVVAYSGVYPFSQRKAYSQLAELMIYVHPQWQGRRIGSQLLEELHRGNFLGGLFTILVLVNKENTHVHRMFERLGYVHKGELTDVATKFGRRHSLEIYQQNVGS